MTSPTNKHASRSAEAEAPTSYSYVVEVCSQDSLPGRDSEAERGTAGNGSCMEYATEHYIWLVIQLILYFVTAPIALYCPLKQKFEWYLLIPMAFFLIFDGWFVKSDYSKRSVEECLADIRSMCTYVSYYIPAAAVILSFSNGCVLRAVHKEDCFALVLIAMGVGASAIAMMWVPIPRYFDENREPTKELKMCYLVVCFMEKVAIIFVLAGLFRLGRAILEMEEDRCP